MYKIHPILWTVGFEWLLYLLLPLVLVPIWKRLGVGAVVILGFALAVGPRVLPIQHLIGWPLAMFSIGMASACLIAGFDRPGPILLSIVAAIVGGMLMAGNGFGCLALHDLVSATFAASLIVGLANRPTSPIHRFLGSNQLALIAAFSYSVYLVHPPILAACTEFSQRAGCPESLVYVSNLAVGVPAALCVAYVFARVFEAPFLTKRAKRPSLDLCSQSRPPLDLAYAQNPR
jgi:peptidoglycan/LPS O-acetylase OafA/YrhL